MRRGLYLLVKKSGAKHWRLKYRVNGKEKTLAIGVFPEVTLAMARKRRDVARVQIQTGIDPNQVKKSKKDAIRSQAANTFEFIAKEWLQKRGDKAASTDKKLVRLLERDIFPYK